MHAAAFVVGNQNFNMTNNRKIINRQNENNNRMEDLEVELKNKIEKIKNFNPATCYDFSELNDDYLDYTTPSSKTPNDNHSISKEANNIIYKNDGNIGTNITLKKILFFKKLIKWIDIIVSLFIIIGCILSQFEDEFFYNNNYQDRVGVVKLIIYIKKNNKLPDDISNYNISYHNNTEIWNNINFTDAFNIPLFLEISTTCQILRVLVVILTLFCIPLIIVSRYIEYLRDYIYKQKLETPFIKSSYFKYLVYEILIIIPFQYPGLSGYTIYYELGDIICLPYSSCFSVVSFIRFYFLLKLFKHLTTWTSTDAEEVCEKYVCKADTSFAFKAFQKENPFLILFVIFILTCVCFGLALRTFELHYWETKDVKTQNWDYVWNSMWCIFVSMTTVGFGDYSAKTQVGRIITIIACIIGIYFVSMMMVFMTQKSVLDEKEDKAYKLVSRLKLRTEIRDIQSYIVLSTLKMSLYTKQKEKGVLENKNFEIKYNYEKRKINNFIQQMKEKNRIIESFDLITMKEHLYDISERIETDLKEIRTEQNALRFINETLLQFTDSLCDINQYIKKNLYATKSLFSIIEKKPIFEDLNKVDFSIKELYTTEFNIPRINFINNIIDNNNILDQDDEYEDNIFNYDVSKEQVQEYFEFIFSKNNNRARTTNRATRTMSFIHKMKTNEIRRNTKKWGRKKLISELII